MYHSSAVPATGAVVVVLEITDAKRVQQIHYY